MSKTETEKRPHTSLWGYLTRAILCFLLVILVLFWLFEVVLINVVYEQVRRSDLEIVGNKLIAAVGTEELSDVAFRLSVDELVSVSVYRIKGMEGTKVLSQSAGTGAGGLWSIPADRLEQLYRLASEQDGSYLTKVTFGGYEVTQNFWQELTGTCHEEGVTSEMMNLLSVRVCEKDNVQYLLLLSTSLVPLEATVRTIQHQLFWLSLIVFLSALFLTLVISHHITRPIIRMNAAAKQLAAGNYNAQFEDRHGYRETQELAASLSFAAQELARTDRLQKELIANISHDLRTPLTLIRGYGETMRDIPGENTPENIQIIIDETEHLSELVSDLLDLSRIQSGVRCPMMEFFNLTAVIREVMTRYEAFTKAQGYAIRLEADCDVPVFADRGMILQVVYNLINNAINYTGKDLSVTVRQSVHDGKVRIEVRDTGAGIPADEIPLIWDRYYKVDKVHRIARIGTGLGLSIAKEILEVHNAAYGVDSEVGHGSSFWFELPVSAPPEETERPTNETGGTV